MEFYIARGLGIDEFEKIRLVKNKERGAFEEGIKLLEVRG